MKKFTMLCVDLTTWLQIDKRMQPGRGYKGMLQMTEEDEKFAFHEALPQTCERNPTLWTGSLLNVHKNKRGELMVNFKRTVLDARLDPCTFADEVFVELERAKAELDL